MEPARQKIKLQAVTGEEEQDRQGVVIHFVLEQDGVAEKEDIIQNEIKSVS
jgi:hypothetical protein